MEAYDVTTRPAVGVRFHPALPLQEPDKVWAYNGTFPPKLIKARYGRPHPLSQSQRPADRPGR